MHNEATCHERDLFGTNLASANMAMGVVAHTPNYFANRCWLPPSIAKDSTGGWVTFFASFCKTRSLEIYTILVDHLMNVR